MPEHTRVGDMTVGTGSHGLKCCPHTIIGFVIIGSPDVYANEMNMARIGDITIHNCPHCPIGILLTGSPDVYANKIQVSRMGDSVNEVCGSGTVVTGSPDVIANG